MVIGILYPVFAQIILTFVLLVAVGWARRKAILTPGFRITDIALDASRWPDDARKVANCYANQFELPVIFYVLCLIALLTGKADFLMVVLAWTFVASRIVHALIHTGSNIVPQRGAAFALGMLILMIMTGILLVRLLARF
jgi:hypothetical protein